MSRLLHRVYYAIKPALPWRVRMGLRRQRARRLRKRHAASWPVDPRTAAAPTGWPGWPEGKRFAFVLTHDVEGQSGYDKCPALMQLETALGFRSLFNLVPEGEYQVQDSFVSRLKAEGFEVGVHDLHHDGSLYASKDSFFRQAPRIRQHLQHWGARGFRAGFMFHNLEWLHALETDYDLSTFDTDPFEPQPDAAGTIFPFWVARNESSDPARNKQGYVEMPYTLPQDSTLFLVLQESSPRLWLEKLDWVARHGGLALVNVHPDYLRFDEQDSPSRTYPAEHYRALLEYVKTNYADQAWFALPGDVANYISAHSAPSASPR